MIWDYLYTFAQSSTLEVPIYFLFYRSRLTLGRTFLIVTLANSFTHPWVFFGFMGSGWTYLVSVLVAESFAVGGETCLHSWSGHLPPWRTFAAAWFANLFSWQIAPLLTYAVFF